MKVEISPASLAEKPLIQRMMELYQYDFSEFDGADLNEHGCYGYPFLDLYWSEKGRYPFIVRVNGKLAGFVLVIERAYLPGNQRSIAEFFILRKYRRQGIGRQVAFHIFNRFPGRWEVQQIPANLPAQRFWRRVIHEYTGGQYSETFLNNEVWQGPVQYFDNTLLAGRP